MAFYRNRSHIIAERLIKLRDYLYTNASPTHAVKIKDMLTYLANEGHEVEIKTVYSDLKTLEAYFGLEIVYDGRKRGYLLKNPLFEPYELRLIVNSIQAAKFVTQQEADRLTSKIMNKLADNHTRPSLNRRTFIKNRIHAINEEAMQGLDTIYEAIANDNKISFKYFRYALNNYGKSKEYCEVADSRIITASPYWVCWEGDSFWISVVHEGMEKLYLQKEDYLEVKIDEEGQEYIEFGETDENTESAEEVEEFIYSGPLSFSFWELSHMEQIKILPDARVGKDIA